MKLFFRFLFLFLCTITWAQHQGAQEAELLMAKVLISKKKNDPTHKLNSYRYDAYENLKVSGDPEALTGPGYKKTELRKTLKKTGVFCRKNIPSYLRSYRRIQRGY